VVLVVNSNLSLTEGGQRAAPGGQSEIVLLHLRNLDKIRSAGLRPPDNLLTRLGYRFGFRSQVRWQLA
jgi:hypothetical protein